MFDRWIEDGLTDLAGEWGVGLITFSPLAQGLLTNRYLGGIPHGSRMERAHFLRPEHLTDEKMDKIVKLNAMAEGRGQTLAQMALQWNLRDSRVTSVLVGPPARRQHAGTPGTAPRSRRARAHRSHPQKHRLNTILTLPFPIE